LEQNAFQTFQVLTGPNPITGLWKDESEELEEQLAKQPLNAAINRLVEDQRAGSSNKQSGGILETGEPSTSYTTEENEEEITRVEDYLLHPGLKSLERSVMDRCHFCTQFLSTWTR
jgi:hypothetical protein